MRFISFTFSKAYIYFIVFWVLDFLNSVEIIFFVKYTQYNGEYQKEFILLYLVCLNLGELLSGLLVLITKVKMKYLKEIDDENEIRQETSARSLKLIYNDLSIKKNKHILIVIMSILDFLGRGIDLLYLLFFDKLYLEQRHIKWLISVDIFSRIFFSRIILNSKIYKHHKYAMLLCSIGFFIMAIFALQSIIFGEGGKYNNLNSWAYIMFIIAQKIFFSSGDTISKILLTDKFLLPHYLMFYKSLVCFIIFILLIPILFLTSKIKYENFENLFQTGDPHLHILLKLLLIIGSFFACFSIFKIIDIFTPVHVGFVNVASSLFQIIEFTIYQNKIEHLIYLIFYILCLLVVFFGTLIFTEIIIINFWGLNEYTQEGFLLKEQLDNMPPDGTILIDNEENQEPNLNKEDGENVKRVNKTMKYISKKYI